MTFDVQVPKSVRAKIGSLGLTRAQAIRFYLHLRDELSVRLDLNGRRIIAPVRCTTHILRVPDGEGGTDDYFLWVNETQSLGVRIIIDVSTYEL